MTVGRNAAQRMLAQVEQHAVEVIAHVLVRHRETRALHERFQRRLGQRDAFDELDVLDDREFRRGQCREREAAPARADDCALAVLLELDLHAIGQRPDDIEQLACGHRDLACFEIVGLGARDHFDLEIRTRQRDTRRIDVDQQVGEHRQRLTSLDDTDDLLQTSQKCFPLNAESHVALFLSLV